MKSRLCFLSLPVLEQGHVEEVTSLVQSLHPYDVPEVIATPITGMVTHHRAITCHPQWVLPVVGLPAVKISIPKEV